MGEFINLINADVVYKAIDSFNDFRIKLYENMLGETDNKTAIELKQAIELVINNNNTYIPSDEVVVLCDVLIQEIMEQYACRFNAVYFEKSINLLVCAFELCKRQKSPILVIESIWEKEDHTQHSCGICSILLNPAQSSFNRVLASLQKLKKEQPSSKISYIEIVDYESFDIHKIDKYKNDKIFWGCVNDELELKPSQLLPIIKATTCVSEKFIPANCNISATIKQQILQTERGVVSYESLPWLSNSKESSLSILVHGTENRSFLVSEVKNGLWVNKPYMLHTFPFMLFLEGTDLNDVRNKLTSMESDINKALDLFDLSKKFYYKLSKKEDLFRLVICGNNKEDLLNECRFIKLRLEYCFLKNIECKTPLGSYFTPTPLGINGKVVFVYPGIGNAYVGMGKDLIHMFPGIISVLNKYTYRLQDFFHSSQIFPDGLSYSDKEQLKSVNEEIAKDTISVSECGTSYAVLYTTLLKSFFNIEPDFVMGYSMGEVGMYASQNIWQNVAMLSENIRTYPTFKSQLTGKMEVLKYNKAITSWRSYSLLAPIQKVVDLVSLYENVYITMINTPNNVVIAGKPSQCQQLVDDLGCTSIPFDFNLIIHCPLVLPEYKNISDMHTLDIARESYGVKIYSTSIYKPVPIFSKTIAVSIAKAFSEVVDFPKLVNNVFDDGGRIFIETGPQQTCTTWINKILKDKEHLALPMNIRDMKDSIVLSRMISKLFCNHVGVNLDVLYMN